MHRRIQIILLSLLVVGGMQCLCGQSRIVGRIVSKAGEALPYASVLVARDTALREVVSSAMSDDQGAFALSVREAGAYQLGVSYLGNGIYKRSIKLAGGDTLDLGVLQTEEDLVELQTVVVMGEALRVHQLPNGFSVRVDKLRETSNDALDLLRRLPNVQVKEDELSVVGKKNVVVKIGNVVQRIPVGELSTLLKGYDAGLIERVDVIMQPPLRYDPEGNTAMIVLHTSSVFREYMGGLLGTELMKGSHDNDRYGGYGSLLYNRGKLYWSVAPSAHRSHSYTFEDVGYIYPQHSYKLTTPSYGANTYVGGNATLQYQHHARGYVGLMASVRQRRVDNRFERQERNTPQTPLSPDASTLNTYSSRSPKLDVTAYWEQAFGKHDSKMWLEATYLNHRDKSETDYRSQRHQDGVEHLTYHDSDRLSVSSLGLNNDYSFVLDSEGRYLLDAGVKTLLTRTSNRRAHEQWALATPAETYSQSDRLRMDELWLTTYVSGTMRLSPQWWMRAGLRASSTMRKISTEQSSQTLDDHHLVLLPSLHLSYTPTRAHKVYMTLNSSVKQPNFDALNPFKWRISQQTYRRGNVHLAPERNYRYDLGYSYRGALSVSATVKQGRGIITPVATEEAGRIYTQTENVQNSLFWGLEAGYYWDKLWWVNASVGVQYGRSRYTSSHPQLPSSSSGYEWDVEGYALFVLDRARRVTAFVSGSYIGRKQTTVATIRPQYKLGGGVSWFLMERRLSLSLAGMNLLSSRYRGHSDRQGYRIEFDHRYTYPTLYFSVSYKFSNGKRKSLGRSLSTSDIERRL